MLHPATGESELDGDEPSMRLVEYAMALVAVAAAGILALVR
jgi:hypothetical protein